MMPAHPRTYFVMIQPHLAFARAKQFLDAVPSAMCGHYRCQRDFHRGVRERVPTARLLIDRADDHQTLASARTTILVLGLPPGFQGAHRFRAFGTRAQTNLAPA